MNQKASSLSLLQLESSVTATITLVPLVSPRKVLSTVISARLSDLTPSPVATAGLQLPKFARFRKSRSIPSQAHFNPSGSCMVRFAHRNGVLAFRDAAEAIA